MSINDDFAKAGKRAPKGKHIAKIILAKILENPRHVKMEFEFEQYQNIGVWIYPNRFVELKRDILAIYGHNDQLTLAEYIEDIHRTKQTVEVLVNDRVQVAQILREVNEQEEVEPEPEPQPEPEVELDPYSYRSKVQSIRGINGDDKEIRYYQKAIGVEAIGRQVVHPNNPQATGKYLVCPCYGFGFEWDLPSWQAAVKRKQTRRNFKKNES